MSRSWLRRWHLTASVVAFAVLTGLIVSPSAARAASDPQVTGLEYKVMSVHSVLLSWEDDAEDIADVTGWAVRVASGTGAPLLSGTALATLSRSDRSYQLTDLAPSSPYTVRIDALTATGEVAGTPFTLSTRVP